MENQENQWYAPAEQNRPCAVNACPAVPARKKKKMSGWVIMLIAVAVAGLIVGSCLYFQNDVFSALVPGSDDGTSLPDDYKSFFENYYTATEETEECTIETVKARDDATLAFSDPEESQLTAQEIYDICSPSVVAITAYPDAESDSSYYWGSGVIFTEDGYILTNSHVIEGTCRAHVTLWNDEDYEALLVGYDSRTDIAVLKIDASGLTAAKFASSDTLHVGDSVVAIGNPLGKEFRSTMTEGIISGIDRDITRNGVTNSLLQTSAPINEGNSGGALINACGQVIGITNMKMSSQYAGSATIEGVGFAIPSATVQSIVNGILKDGEYRGRPALGITVGPVPETAQEEYDLPAGLYVNAVSDGSDCAAKGIEVGDVITAANGTELTENEDLTEMITDLAVGDEITLTVWHDGETSEIIVQLVDINDVY